MKFRSKLITSALLCLALAACNQPVEEQASAKESNGNDAESTNGMQRKLPECAKRNKDGTYKYGHACTKDQWLEWQKTQDAMVAPER
jgi:hypothetical protein